MFFYLNGRLAKFENKAFIKAMPVLCFLFSAKP